MTEQLVIYVVIALALLLVCAIAFWLAVRHRQKHIWNMYVKLGDRARVAKVATKQKLGRAPPSIKLEIESVSHGHHQRSYTYLKRMAKRGKMGKR